MCSAVKPFFRVEERNCPLLGEFFFLSPLRHSREDSFVRTLYLFQVKNRTTPFVCQKAWSVSCSGLFLGVCLVFPWSSLLRGRFRSLFAVGWKARKGVPVCTWEECSVTINRFRCWDGFTFFQSLTWSAFFSPCSLPWRLLRLNLYLFSTKIGSRCLCVR